MNLKPIIHIRLIILKSLFRCFDTLSNFQKLHKFVVSKKVYLGTAIISLSLVNSACNSKNKSVDKQKSDTDSIKPKQYVAKKGIDSVKAIITKNSKKNNLPPPIPIMEEDSIAIIDERPTLVLCYVMPAAPLPPDSSKGKSEEPAFIVVEENASFQGGDLNTFRNWVQEKLVYPQQSFENGSQGRVFIQFAVNSKGDICDIKVLRSTGDPLLDNEAIRVIKTSPQWKPARQGGANVKQRFTMPVTFKLEQ